MAAPASRSAETRNTMAESASKARKRIQNPPYWLPLGSDIFFPSQGELRNRLQYLPHAAEQAIDLRFLDDERRRQRDDVAGNADQHAALESFHEGFIRAPGGRAGARLELDRRDEPAVADVDDMARTLERVGGVLPVLRDRSRARQQSLVFVGVERADALGAGHRVPRIGIAVVE